MQTVTRSVLIAVVSLVPAAPAIIVAQSGSSREATYITKEEIDTVNKQPGIDRQIRVVDIGSENFAVGIIHRGRTGAPAAGGGGGAARGTAPAPEPCGESAATPPPAGTPTGLYHEQQTEGYYIVSGEGTLVTGGRVVNGRRSAPNAPVTTELNGPSCSGSIVGADVVMRAVKTGDIVIIPAGTPHGWSNIPDHVDYLSFRPSARLLTPGYGIRRLRSSVHQETYMRVNPIRRVSLLLLLSTVVFVPVASAQGFRPIIDHVHLAAPDPASAVAWYRQHFGGQTMAEAADRLLYGDTRVIFSKRENAQPSQGSAIDHIGFSVVDLDVAMKAFEAAGVKIVQPVRDVAGLFKLAFIEDPWGTRIEVAQDSQKLGLHHIHLRGPDPAAMLAWYSTQFGGRTGKLKERIDGIDMTGVWILVQRGEAVPSQGHSIDHLGFRPVDVDASVAQLKTQNVKITTEPRPLTFANGVTVRLAFAEAPDGVRLELVQRPE